MLFIGGSCLGEQSFLRWWVTLMSFTCFIQFNSRVVRNEKSKGWLPTDSYTFHPRKEKIICAVQMRSHCFTCWVPCRLHCKAKACRVFGVQNQLIKDVSGETKGETWLKLLATVLESFIFLSGCLAAIHGVAFKVSLMQTQCLRLLWWGCLRAHFSDT